MTVPRLVCSRRCRCAILGNELGPTNFSAAVVEGGRGQGAPRTSVGRTGEGRRGARGYARVTCKMPGEHEGVIGCTVIWHDDRGMVRARGDEGYVLRM